MSIGSAFVLILNYIRMVLFPKGDNYKYMKCYLSSSFTLFIFKYFLHYKLSFFESIFRFRKKSKTAQWSEIFLSPITLKMLLENETIFNQIYKLILAV